MLSIAERKYLRTLKNKKNREEEKLFVVEGLKMVREVLNSEYHVRAVYVQDKETITTSIPTRLITESEMAEVSHFSTPSPALALVEQAPKQMIPNVEEIDKSCLYLGLDSIRDPGNLGTIIRIADWFGIKAIFASVDTVDLYNTKVIQSSMGAIFRIPVYYADLNKLIDTLDIPVFGTATEGESVYDCDLSNSGVIVIGNESNGISSPLQSKIDQMLMIPSFNSDPSRSESLNAAVATAIICSEFRRRCLR
ncbi:MAG: RNA methyltransferase [Prevotellaceae bacterium]|jgi:TrmH family RNA methyltransferase|nr:RNA methyltransferase [Prevotellaceae bacterium]